MSNRSKSMLVLVVGMLIPPRPIPTADASTQTVSRMKADFNGDGWEDLAIGAPTEEAPGAVNAGAVTVMYGSQNGLTPVGHQFFRQGSGGLPEQPESDDRFGQAIAAGDFNADTYSDLAIGAPYDDSGSIPDAGNVIVLYGSFNGLTSAGSMLFDQASSCPRGGEIEGQATAGDQFGWALATGDFNGDTYDDLAIGVPWETVDADNVYEAGAVNIIYGSPLGLLCQDNQIWHQGSSGIDGDPEESDLFGLALAAGDFNGDGREDLAIGVPHEDSGSGVVDVGVVNVLLGTPFGLDAAGNQLWAQFGTGDEVYETDDRYGSALAAGYFDADNFEDLAIGAPGENLGSIVDAGALNVLYGSAGSLSHLGAQFLSQATPGILGTAQYGDHFGAALASGDFQGDGSDDLAVGVPDDQDNRTGAGLAGSVNVLYGSGNQLWNQDSPGIADIAEQPDGFGRSVGVGDFNGDGIADLAVGVPYEEYVSAPAEGVAHVIYGSRVAKGLSSAGSQILWQGLFGQAAQPVDFFGWALSSR